MFVSLSQALCVGVMWFKKIRWHVGGTENAVAIIHLFMPSYMCDRAVILCSSLGNYRLLESSFCKGPGDVLFNPSTRSARSVYTKFVFHTYSQHQPTHVMKHQHRNPYLYFFSLQYASSSGFQLGKKNCVNSTVTKKWRSCKNKTTCKFGSSLQNGLICVKIKIPRKIFLLFSLEHLMWKL